MNTVGNTTKELFDALINGDETKARALLESNPALLEARDTDGETPLHRAVSSAALR
ncbi:MAG: ankyrin repeat domain-containing protein [Vulcanimicrobiota bacterium]